MRWGATPRTGRAVAVAVAVAVVVAVAVRACVRTVCACAEGYGYKEANVAFFFGVGVLGERGKEAGGRGAARPWAWAGRPSHAPPRAGGRELAVS